jgi:hypothetical protein
MDLFRYILGHLLRMQLSPAFAARLLDLQIDTASSKSVSVRASTTLDDDRSDYAPLLERLRSHAAETFTNAAFDPKARALRQICVLPCAAVSRGAPCANC